MAAAVLEGTSPPALEEESWVAKVLEASGTSELGVQRVRGGQAGRVLGTAAAVVV